jgi:hypothetical protein
MDPPRRPLTPPADKRSADTEKGVADTEKRPEPANIDKALSRDRFVEASADIMLHITDKVVALTRKQEFLDRLQTILDPLVNHVISRVFPYILLSSILFLILLLVSVTTFVIVVRGSLLAIRSVDMTMKTGLPDDW